MRNCGHDCAPSAFAALIVVLFAVCSTEVKSVCVFNADTSFTGFVYSQARQSTGSGTGHWDLPLGRCTKLENADERQLLLEGAFESNELLKNLPSNVSLLLGPTQLPGLDVIRIRGGSSTTELDLGFTVGHWFLDQGAPEHVSCMTC